MSAKCTVADPYNQSNSMMILMVIMLINLMFIKDNDNDYTIIPACSRFGFGTFAPLAENRHNMAEQKTGDCGVHHVDD